MNHTTPKALAIWALSQAAPPKVTTSQMMAASE
jgi:hypothetical protein